MKKKNKYNMVLAFSLVCFCLLSIFLLGKNYTNISPVFQKERFTGGSVIEGVDVSGLTVSEANSLLKKNLSKTLSSKQFEVEYKDNTWQIGGDEFDLDTAIVDTIDQAFQEVKAQGITLSNRRNYKLSLGEIFNQSSQKLDKIIESIEKEPKNASVKFNPNADEMFLITSSENGIKVDKEDLYKQFEKAFRSGKDINKIEISTLEVEPDIKEDYFDGKQQLMGEFSTTLKNSQEGRRYNVSYALSKFNGLVVQPNETISFNQITGPQTLQGGYQKAIIIMNGVFTEGVGGGLCQASTTLYNACLLANMEILEVHKHTLPVSYVELSLDAMVSDGYSDFIFKNTSPNPIYIQSFVKGDDAVVKIFGKSKKEGEEIKRVVEFVGTISHNGDKIIPDTQKEYSDKVLYKGEYYRLKYPREGYEARAFLEYYKDGVLVDKKEIRHEKYLPINGIVVEGVEELPEGFVLPPQEVEIISPQIS